MIRTVPKQKTGVTAFVERQKLTIGKFDQQEIEEIVKLSEETRGKISITDFSICFYAKKNGYTLLTGDKNLRKVAIDKNINVHGILYLFDELISHKILPLKLAIEIITKLKVNNTRLPLEEIDARIKKWEFDLRNDL